MWVPDAVDLFFYISNMFERGPDLLQYWLSVGIGASSHYSGCAGDLVWTGWVQDCMERAALIPYGCPGFVLIDACDIAPHCQKCLVEMDPPFCHVGTDMFDRLPADLRQLVDELAPQPGGDKGVFECQYEAVSSVLPELVNYQAPSSSGLAAPPSARCTVISKCYMDVESPRRRLVHYKFIGLVRPA